MVVQDIPAHGHCMIVLGSREEIVHVLKTK